MIPARLLPLLLPTRRRSTGPQLAGVVLRLEARGLPRPLEGSAALRINAARPVAISGASAADKPLHTHPRNGVNV